jgi:hypothetical protein
MRATLAYTTARILLFVVSVIVLYLVGARSVLLLALALLVSGIASYVLLSRQRDRMSGALIGRLKNGRQRTSGLRARLEEGARAEDGDWATGTGRRGLGDGDWATGTGRRGLGDGDWATGQLRWARAARARAQDRCG